MPVERIRAEFNEAPIFAELPAVFEVLEIRTRPDPATQPDAWRAWYDETRRCIALHPMFGGRCYQERCSPTSLVCLSCSLQVGATPCPQP